MGTCMYYLLNNLAYVWMLYNHTCIYRSVHHWYIKPLVSTWIPSYPRGLRGCDHMVVGFTTTCAISAYDQ